MRIKSILLSFSFLVTSLSSFSVLAEEQLLITVKRMSMEVAARIAQATVDACRKEGVQVTAAVVDRTGTVQVLMRDVLAPDLSLRIAEQKAYTATVFNMATADMEGRFTGSYSIGKDPKLVIAKGGIPINAGGRILGGIGVSGAPSGDIDEKCAKAGLEAVLDDLEMAE